MNTDESQNPGNQKLNTKKAQRTREENKIFKRGLWSI